MVEMYAKLDINGSLYDVYKPRELEKSKLKALEWWISRIILDPLFFLISRPTGLIL